MKAMALVVFLCAPLVFGAPFLLKSQRQKTEQIQPLNEEARKPSRHRLQREVLGLNPNARFHHQVSVGERLLFSVEYETDAYGRRKGLEFKNGKAHALFVGGSFVFGHGLSAANTLPVQFAKRTHFQSYNYGVNGAGPFNLLALLENRDLKKEVKGSEGFLFYFHINAHLSRAYGTNFYQDQFQKFPVYRVRDQQLIFEGSVKQVYPWSSWVLSHLTPSFLKTHFHLESFLLKVRRSPARDWAWAYSLAEIKKIYLRQFPKGQFYFVLYPSIDLDPSLRSKLSQLQVKILEFQQPSLSLNGPAENVLDLVYDRHPSALFNQRMAKVLSNRLKIAPH